MQKRKVRAIGILVAILSISVLSGCGASKQKQVKTTRATQESNVAEKKDSVKNTEEPTTTFSTTEMPTSKVTSTTASKKVSTTTTETPIATKKDEQKAAVKATVTYNGFSDTNSVEMKMSDGSYEVMIVEKEDLIQKLEDLDPGTKVTIQYKAKAGQANKQIIKVF